MVNRVMIEASGRTAGPSRHDPRGLIVRQSARFRLLTTKAQRPTAREAQENPRSRSARLRAMQRTAPSEASAP
jgi:16S rRNA (cytosine1402-N4)-methyltransferase